MKIETTNDGGLAFAKTNYFRAMDIQMKDRVLRTVKYLDKGQDDKAYASILKLKRIYNFDFEEWYNNNLNKE